MAEKNPSRLVVVVADMAKSDLPLSSSFVAEFCQRLSLQSPVLHLAAAGSNSGSWNMGYPSNNWSILRVKTKQPTRFPSATVLAVFVS